MAAVLGLLAAAPYTGTALVVSRAVANPDAIVSLASHEWERLPAVARLASQNPRALVLLTLPQPATVFNCHDCSNRLDRLRHFGVARSRVQVVPLHAGGTYGEALAIASYARQKGIRRLLIVTSPYHTRRSLATFASAFRGTGVEVGIEPARDSPADPSRWWRAPYDRAYVTYEWTATIYYRLKYGIALL